MKKKVFTWVGFIVLIASSVVAFGQKKEWANSKTQIYGLGWSATHADGGNTDYSPVAGSRNIKLAWQQKFSGTINLGPTTDTKGRIYVTTSGEGCHLYALDHKTGETIWCTDKVNQFAVASSALLDNEGHVFIADNEAMYAFDDTGKLLWKMPIAGFPLSAQFTQTGRLIFITHIGQVYVLDRATGQPVMKSINLAPSHEYSPDFDPRACMLGTQDCPCANTLAFDQQSGRFYFTFWAPGASQADLRAMQYTEEPIPAIIPLWTNESLPGGSASSPDLSFDGTRLYVNDNSGRLYAIDATTGENIWNFVIGYNPGGSQSTSPEGMIMPAGGRNAPVMCIADCGTHAELVWKNDSLQNRGVATQCAGNLAYVTVKTKGFQNDLIVIDTELGRELDREHLPGTTIFTVGTTIGFDGYVYVPSFNGCLFAFRPESQAF